MEIRKFSQENWERCEKAFDRDCHSIEFFMIAIPGEVGEACNYFKKILRGDFGMTDSSRAHLIEELADVITYCDLAIHKLGGSTEDALIQKFNTVSARRGYPVVLSK